MITIHQFPPSKQFIDLTGRVFGRLTVESYAGVVVRKTGRSHRWNCRCECGVVRIVHRGALVRGMTKSCGCLNREVKVARSTTHGARRFERWTPEYSTWISMRSRCTNPKSNSFKYYGGRGITVCKRWADSFENFLSDMGQRPTGTSIDRIDTALGYSPENCRWATSKEQARNRRNSRFLTHNGQTLRIYEWAEITGILSSKIYGRIYRGWPVEMALSVNQN